MKEYNYCPYCGEKLKDNIKQQNTEIEDKYKEDYPNEYFFNISENKLKEQKIVVISLPLESMRLPFTIDYNKVPQAVIEEVDKRRKDLIYILKKLEERNYEL